MHMIYATITLGCYSFLVHSKRLYVPDVDDLHHQVVSLAHSAGHEGIQKHVFDNFQVKTPEIL